MEFSNSLFANIYNQMPEGEEKVKLEELFSLIENWKYNDSTRKNNGIVFLRELSVYMEQGE